MYMNSQERWEDTNAYLVLMSKTVGQPYMSYTKVECTTRPTPPSLAVPGKNSIQVLHEWYAKWHDGEVPQYWDGMAAGEHCFHVFCKVGDDSTLGQSTGRTKNEAKKAAALEGIRELRAVYGATSEEEAPELLPVAPWRYAAEDVPSLEDGASPLAVLNQYLQKIKVDLRRETEDNSEPATEDKPAVPSFCCEYFYGDLSLAREVALSKKKAQQQAALVVLEYMRAEQLAEESRR